MTTRNMTGVNMTGGNMIGWNMTGGNRTKDNITCGSRIIKTLRQQHTTGTDQVSDIGGNYVK